MSDYLYGFVQGQEYQVEIDCGVCFYVGLEVIGDVDDKGMCMVMMMLNGQLCLVFVCDCLVFVDVYEVEKVDIFVFGQVVVFFFGVVIFKVEVGFVVCVGELVVLIEVMKMEVVIMVFVDGIIECYVIVEMQQVDVGDFLVVICLVY